MNKLHWLDSHVGSIDEGIKLIDQFYWNITVVEKESLWVVMGGDQVIFETDSHEEVDVFLYGMSLAYSILSPKFIANFRAEMNIP